MRLVTVEEHPFNAETPLPEFSRGMTPENSFFVRSHFDAPYLDSSAYRLAVEGAVATSLLLSLDEIQSFPPREVTLTLECAGNGRTRLNPPVSGVRWGYGAASTARFRGTSLHHVLDRAGSGSAAVEALFVGADRGEADAGGVVAFERSLPLPIARLPDTILAWKMNGEPLTRFHGFPLRLVVPRWYAMASVKWLTHIHLLSEPFRGHFQKRKYRYEQEAGTPDGTPVTTMRVRAVIATPVEGTRLPRGPAEVAGVAWSGEGAIQRVQVSLDGGLSWRDATLERALSAHAWTPWRLDCNFSTGGGHTLLARATDAQGNTQPLESSWNAQGYGNNVVQRVCVRIA